MDQDLGGYQSNPFVARIYDQVIPYRDRPDVEFFVEAAVKSGGPVLEVGCGTGRVLIPTARAGISITGLDLSDHMLDVCREALIEEPELVQNQVKLVQGNPSSWEPWTCCSVSVLICLRFEKAAILPVLKLSSESLTMLEIR